jgi:hypothetical protein
MHSSNVTKALQLFRYLVKLPFSNPRGLREVAGVALNTAAGVADSEIDVLPIPIVSLTDLVADEKEPIHIENLVFPQITFSISIIEAVTLALLMHKAKAKRVFEFGTHRGVSTTQLCANLPTTGELFTLDLPDDDRSTQFRIDHVGDAEVSQYPTKADLIPMDMRNRIRFLRQDSALFDPSPFRESIDFVFVDAAHTASYVENDSEKAWTMLRPGGIVAWHDCRPESADVVRYLRACRFGPKRIAGGTLAFATKPDS